MLRCAAVVILCRALGNLLGGNLAFGIRKLKNFMPRILNRRRLMAVNMPCIGSDNALNGG